MKLKTLTVFIFISLLSLASPVFALTPSSKEIAQDIEDLKVDQNNPLLSKEPEFDWPVEFQGISTYFHDPNYYFRNRFQHPGIDLQTLKDGRPSPGLPVHAAEDGVVIRAYARGRNYSYLVILHGKGFSTVYGHLSKILVLDGQEVQKGQTVALSGAEPGAFGSGPVTTGPHLHFEVRIDGVPVNPLHYLPKEPIIYKFSGSRQTVHR